MNDGARVFLRVVFIVVILVVIVGGMMGCMGCTRIEPGHVGIRVNMAGDQRGVEDFPATTGWVFYNPVTQRIFEYPCFVQTANWSGEEQADFGSKEGMQITGDINLSYQLDCEKIPHFYVKFRSDDLNTFTHGYLRNIARDAFNNIGSQYEIDKIYGEKKEAFVEAVRQRIDNSVKDYGVTVMQFGFMGALRIPNNVLESLNAKVQATQIAMQTENELRTIDAEAKKKVAAAEGERLSAIKAAEGRKAAAILSAEGEREAKILEAQGIAEANRRIAASLTPGVLEWQRIQVQMRWDGSVPSVMTGGSGTLLQLPPVGGKK